MILFHFVLNGGILVQCIGIWTDMDGIRNFRVQKRYECLISVIYPTFL